MFALLESGDSLILDKIQRRAKISVNKEITGLEFFHTTNASGSYDNIEAMIQIIFVI